MKLGPKERSRVTHGFMCEQGSTMEWLLVEARMESWYYYIINLEHVRALLKFKKENQNKKIFLNIVPFCTIFFLSFVSSETYCTICTLSFLLIKILN